jgi:hypothetical protein
LISTNFFEIKADPLIDELYVTEGVRRKELENAGELVTSLSDNSVLSFSPFPGSKKVTAKPQYVEWLLKKALFQRLESSTTLFDIDYRRGEVTVVDDPLLRTEVFSVLRRLVLRVFEGRGHFFLAIDPITKVYNRLSVHKLVRDHRFVLNKFLEHNRCLVFVQEGDNRKWVRGLIRAVTTDEVLKVEVPNLFDGTIEVNSNRVIPSIGKAGLLKIAAKSKLGSNLETKIKRLAEFTSKRKFEETLRAFRACILPLFPMTVGEVALRIESSPLKGSLFPVSQIPANSEPEYVVERQGISIIRDKKRLTALSRVNQTSFIKEHNVVLFGTGPTITILDRLVNQLNEGMSQSGYEFSLPSKFGVRLKVIDRFIAAEVESLERVTDKLIYSDQERHNNAFSLVYLPALSDLYYSLKAKLAHHGRISQVISHEHFDIYSAWNLATNIYAKLGYAPWAISESSSIPNADIVLGIATSSLKHEGKIRRNVAYVNVFDKNGVWQLVQSSAEYIDYENRVRLMPQIIRNAIVGFLSGGTRPKTIDIHFTKRFSYQERVSVLRAVREVVPDIEEVNFISIDTTHPLRVFDETDPQWNFGRGGVLQLSRSEFLLSVAGESKPALRAPRILKIRTWREGLAQSSTDSFPIAYRVLAMTKLNWRSPVNDTSEPVTLKYAEEIAKLTNHFSLTEWRSVNTLLSRFPWFI